MLAIWIRRRRVGGGINSDGDCNGAPLRGAGANIQAVNLLVTLSAALMGRPVLGAHYLGRVDICLAGLPAYNRRPSTHGSVPTFRPGQYSKPSRTAAEAPSFTGRQ